MRDAARKNRKGQLERMLRARQDELSSEISLRLRTARSEGARRTSEEVDRSDAVIQGEMDYSLIQMKTETLRRIREALVRLDAGTYGSCVECDDEISEKRLLALPFAVRCKTCEESREQHLRQSRQDATRRAGVVVDAIG